MEPNLLNGFLEFCLSSFLLSSTGTWEQPSPRGALPEFSLQDILTRVNRPCQDAWSSNATPEAQQGST